MTTIDRRYYYYTLFAIPIGLLTGAMFVHTDTKTIDELLLRCFINYINIDMANLTGYMITLLPFLLQIYLFSTILHCDFDRTVCYVFTRSYSRKSWFRQKYITIIFISFLYYLFLFLSVIIVGILYGNTIANTFWFILLAIWIPAISNSALIILANIMSLTIKEHYVFLIIWGIHSPLLLTTSYLIDITNRADWIKFLPHAQFSLSWHDIPQLAKDFPDYFESYINNFNLIFSVIYLFLVYIILYIIGSYLIKHQDLSIRKGN